MVLVSFCDLNVATRTGFSVFYGGLNYVVFRCCVVVHKNVTSATYFKFDCLLNNKN